MTDTPDAPALPPADSGSFFGNLFNLFFEPWTTFEKIFVSPRVWLAIILQTVLAVGFSSVWLAKMDPKEFMRQQMEQNPRIQQMPADQVDRIVDMQANAMKTWGRIGPVVAPVLLDLIIAGFFLFVFRFFVAADVTFSQSLATVAWSFLVVGLVQTPILLAVFSIKDDWNLDPNEVIQANLTLFFDRADLPRWLWSLLGSFDLFSFWPVFLMATGFAVAAKRALSTGLWSVGVPWACFVIVKMVFRLIIG